MEHFILTIIYVLHIQIYSSVNVKVGIYSTKQSNILSILNVYNLNKL